ncbi:tudor and KH domain-containing protein [Rhincodon typus]|uniref:tudor and KH domain-containing protein n=1 Tax=Rhincodon typus TaxID=259920 RepID=UPI00202EC217|nr:tudor and KH domain-containing protein [Rhincodon typus]
MWHCSWGIWSWHYRKLLGFACSRRSCFSDRELGGGVSALGKMSLGTPWSNLTATQKAMVVIGVTAGAVAMYILYRRYREMQDEHCVLVGDNRIAMDMKVPRDAVKVIIGRQGSTIKQLRKDTGARIEVEDGEELGGGGGGGGSEFPAERLLTIVGSPVQVCQAKVAIHQLLADSAKVSEELWVPHRAMGRIIGNSRPPGLACRPVSLTPARFLPQALVMAKVGEEEAFRQKLASSAARRRQRKHPIGWRLEQAHGEESSGSPASDGEWAADTGESEMGPAFIGQPPHEQEAPEKDSLGQNNTGPISKFEGFELGSPEHFPGLWINSPAIIPLRPSPPNMGLHCQCSRRAERPVSVLPCQCDDVRGRHLACCPSVVASIELSWSELLRLALSLARILHSFPPSSPWSPSLLHSVFQMLISFTPPQLFSFVTFPSPDFGFPADEHLEVYVSASENPSHFWIQILGSRCLQLDNLTYEMSRYYSSLPGTEEFSPKPGDIVAAPFAGDSSWYRARVLGFLASGNADLYYVDYGDNGEIPIGKLQLLRSDFLSLPFQAVECCLDGIQPVRSEWTNEAMNCFDALTSCASWKILLARICSYSQSGGVTRPQVKLFDRTGDENLDVGEELIRLGHATRCPRAAGTAAGSGPATVSLQTLLVRDESPGGWISAAAGNYWSARFRAGRHWEAHSCVCLKSLKPKWFLQEECRGWSLGKKKRPQLVVKDPGRKPSNNSLSDRVAGKARVRQHPRREISESSLCQGQFPIRRKPRAAPGRRGPPALPVAALPRRRKRRGH